jgi:hypothetical protein
VDRSRDRRVRRLGTGLVNSPSAVPAAQRRQESLTGPYPGDPAEPGRFTSVERGSDHTEDGALYPSGGEDLWPAAVLVCGLRCIILTGGQRSDVSEQAPAASPPATQISRPSGLCSISTCPSPVSPEQESQHQRHPHGERCSGQRPFLRPTPPPSSHPAGRGRGGRGVLTRSYSRPRHHLGPDGQSLTLESAHGWPRVKPYSVQSPDSGFGFGIRCPFLIPLCISRPRRFRRGLTRGRIRLFITRA